MIILWGDDNAKRYGNEDVPDNYDTSEDCNKNVNSYHSYEQIKCKAINFSSVAI